jgi:hypothetical protein
MVGAYPDLTTTTPTANTILLGDVDIGAAKEDLFLNKATGGGTSIARGKVLSKNTAVTPNVFRVASDADAGPYYVSATPADFDYANPTISAQEGDDRVHAWLKARVVLQISGNIQPGSAITNADNGKVKLATASDPILGTFIGLKGTFGANVVAQGATNDQLGWCDFDGRAI